MKNPMKELWGYVAISTGMAMAASCFTAMGFIFSMVPSGQLVGCIVLAGLVSLLMSFCFSQLSSLYPSSPGIGFYFKAAFGEKVSLFFLFLYLSLVCLLAGVECFVFTQLLKMVLPELFPRFHLLLAHGILILVLFANFRGLSLSRALQNGTTAVLILGILTLAALALAQAPAASVLTSQSIPIPIPISGSGESGKFLKATGTAIFLFMGFEWVITLGKSPAAYKKLVPLSMPLSLGILILMYVLFARALAGHFSSGQLAMVALPQLQLSQKIFPAWGRAVVLVLTFLAIFSTFNAGIMGGARILYSMSRERYLPAWISKVSSQGTPMGALIVLGVTALISSLTINYFRLEELCTGLGAAIQCLVYAALCLSYGKIKKTGVCQDKPSLLGNKLPAWPYRILAMVLAVLGLGVIFPPGAALSPTYPAWIFLLLVLGSWVLTLNRLKLKQARKKLRPGIHPLESLKKEFQS